MFEIHIIEFQYFKSLDMSNKVDLVDLILKIDSRPTAAFCFWTAAGTSEIHFVRL